MSAVPVPLIEDGGAETVAFRLSQPAGGDVGEVLGYDLRDYNPDFDGPSEFISPLSIQWPDAPPVVIFDSDIHGYHGEMGSSAKLRGRGEPTLFACPKCRGVAFRVTLQFDYWEACLDIWEEEPDLAIQDYFCNLIVDGECAKCRQVSSVLDMDL